MKNLVVDICKENVALQVFGVVEDILPIGRERDLALKLLRFPATSENVVHDFDQPAKGWGENVSQNKRDGKAICSLKRDKGTKPWTFFRGAQRIDPRSTEDLKTK